MPPIGKKYQTQPYPVHPRIKRFFDEHVNAPFLQHAKTKIWMREVADRTWQYHSNNILERGRATFLSEKNDLSPADQVIVYCHYYMHQHAASGMHVLLRGLADHKMGFLRNTVMIDFGCGPMTGAISLAWYNLVAGKNGDANKLHLRYIGIDRSQAMLDHCEAFPKNLFHPESTFDFKNRSTAFTEVPTLFAKRRAEMKNLKITLLLNFSYVFGAKLLDVGKLLAFVTAILDLLRPGDLACLVFQNAKAWSVNQKWEEFKKGIKGRLRCICCETETITYHDAGAKSRQKSVWGTDLRRELLLNQTWVDKLKEK